VTNPDLIDAYRDATGAATRGFERTVGYVVHVEGEIARIHLDVVERHLNPYGAAHGGVTLTLLDTAGGVQVFLRARPARMATINMATQFVDLVPPGPVVATARIDRLGKSVAHTTSELRARNPNGPLLATAVASYRLFGVGAS
jgi:uncharacterized protein (TIGR00369 family)